MSNSYSFIDLLYLETSSVPSVPSLESFEEDSESVFSMSRRSPSPTVCESSTHPFFLLPTENPITDEESPIRHDKIFVEEASPIIKQEVFPLVEPLQANVSESNDPSHPVQEPKKRGRKRKAPEGDSNVKLESNDPSRPVQELKKRGRKQKAPENESSLTLEREFSPFPKYYKFTSKELTFFKNIKLVQSSSDITHIKDNIYMIEIVHHDKSVELIRCFRSLTDHKMYFCAVDVFYPITAIKENVNREVKKRVSPKNYYILHIESKGKSLTFVDLIGFVDIVRYRMNPKSAANQGIRDLIRCNELAIELQKYL